MPIDPKTKRRLEAKIERQKKSALKNSDSEGSVNGTGALHQTKKRKTLLSTTGNIPIVNKTIMSNETRLIDKMRKEAIPDADVNTYSLEKARKRAKRGIKGGASLNF